MSAGSPFAWSPFKGLSAFDDSDLDALFFFGRERERDVIVANMLATRLTVLYGASGVGKSSVLRAAVVRELRRLAPTALVRVHDGWSSGNVTAPFAAARDAVECFLIFDQFEEFFLYHDADRGAGMFAAALGDLLRETQRAHVLLSVRDDALSHLDVFTHGVPSILANRLHLEQLDREAARAAILGPVRRWNELHGESFSVDDALVDAVLTQVTAAPVGGRGDQARVEAPFLQLVMERLWREERSAGSDTLRLGTLLELGGAQAIVREHLDRALGSLEAGQRQIAGSVFSHLVTPTGTKIAHRARDLAEYAGVSEEDLAQTLDQLTRERIVRGVDGAEDGDRRYEIFHDVLAASIRAWESRREVELERAAARRRQRRLLLLVGVALAALAVVAGVAVFALVERGDARSQANHAHARELEATALQQLSLDPERSLMLALDAARLEPGQPAEDVLRRALLAARMRLVLSAHGPVRSVAYSPGGALVATASSDGRMRIFAVATGRLELVRRVPTRLTTVAFSPDGRRVLAAGDDGVADVWTVAGGKLVLRLRQRGPVASAAFGRDGRVILVASRSGTATICDAESGRSLATLRRPGAVAVARLSPDSRFVATVAAARSGAATAWLSSTRSGRTVYRLPGNGVADVEFSPDGRLLLAAGRDGSPRLFDVRSGRVVRVLDGGGGSLVVAAFSPDGTLVAAGGQEGAVRVWDVRTGARLFMLVGHTSPITALTWSPDGRLLASASADRTIRLWAVRGLGEAGGLVVQLDGHQEAVTSLAFSPSGRYLVSGSVDWTARVWGVAPEQMLGLLGREPGGVVAARYAESGRVVLAVGRRGTVKVWSRLTRRLVRVFRDPGVTLRSAELSPDGRLLATGAADGEVRLWDARLGVRLRTLDAGGDIAVVRFDRDGTLLAAAGTNGVSVWDPRTGRLLAVLRPAKPAVDVVWSPDSSRLLAAGRYGFAEWSAGSWRRVLSIPSADGGTRVAFAPAGDLFAAASGDGTVGLYRTSSGELTHYLRGHTLAVTALAFSADGASLVSASEDRDARSWVVATGRPLRLFRGHDGPVADVALSPDGRWLATAGPAAAGLWDAATGQLVFYLYGHSAALSTVDFAPDSEHLVTASYDGTVRTYSCDACGTLDQLVRLATKRLERTSRALTPWQQARYLGR